MHKQLRHSTLCLLGVFLAFLMVFYLFPTTVLAAFFGSTEQAPTEEVKETSKEVFELTERREESVKHFRLEDGSVMAIQYAAPVHRADANGQWQDIDNRLSVQFNNIGTADARVKFARQITGNEVLFALQENGRQLSVMLDGTVRRASGAIANTETRWDENADALQKKMTLDNLTSRVLYADVLDGADLEYVVDSNNIKENIIVKTRKSAYAYTFTLHLDGMKAALDDAGNILLTDAGTGEVCYTIPAGYMYDANKATSRAVTYTLTALNNNNYTLTVTADAAWINAADRVFPVTIDPSVNSLINYSSVVDLSIDKNSPTTNNVNGITLYVSDEDIAYWRLNTLPSLPASTYVAEASISMFASAGTNNQVGAYLVTQNWPSYFTWEGHINNPDFGVLGDLLDYNIINGFGLRWYKWDITKAVQHWYDEENNYGIGFATIDGDNTTTRASFYSNNHNASGYRPYLSIRYRDMIGIESYWSYSTQSAGLAGTGYVNRANGVLTWTKGLLSATDSLMPYTPTLVYSSALANQSFTASNAATCSLVSWAPLGFKWNMQETVVTKTYSNATGVPETYYIWCDADGTEHDFFSKGNVYEDNDGLQLTLTVASNQNTVTISDDSKTIRTFERKGLLNEQALGWFLTSITDKNGNTISYSYDYLSAQITEINLIPNGSTGITFFAISTPEQMLPVLVLNPIANEGVFLKYSATPTGSFETYGAQYLREVIYAHGNAYTDESDWQAYWEYGTVNNLTIDGKASYTYNNSGELVQCRDDLAGYAVAYTYAGGRVTSVTEYGGSNNLQGQQITFSYHTGYTEVTTSGSDDEPGTNDDLISRYVFDGAGRVVGGYSTDIDQAKIYGAFAGIYEDKSERVKNNVKESTSIGGTATNYLLNGGFELEQSYWTFSTNAGVSSIVPFEGIYHADLMIAANTTESVSQYVQLPAGTYTLSAIFDTHGCKNAEILLMAESLNDTDRVFTKNIPCNADQIIHWEQLAAMTFTADSYNGNGTEKFKISICATGTVNFSGMTTVSVDAVMLEESIGNSPYNTVQYGHFEPVAIHSDGIPYNVVSSFWDGNYTITTNPAPFGSVARIAGSATETREMVQTVYTVNPQDLTAYNLGEYYDNPPSKTFIVSGFAKASDAVMHANSTFGLRVDVHYCRAPYSSVETISFPFSFQTDCTDWQFVCGTFDTLEGRLIYAIDICCEFSYQPTGSYAYFDNISVFENNDESVVTYSYYYYDAENNLNDPENNATLNGLVHTKQSGHDTEVYEYDNDRRIVRKANNRGELWEYIYEQNSDRVEREVYYHYVRNGSSVVAYPFLNLNPDALITKTPETLTTYTYNTYGQLTTTDTAEATDGNNDDIIYVPGALHITTQNVYVTTAGSAIFGALLQTTDTLGRSVRNYYDPNNGRLLASVNVGGGTGICYTYDGVGNITSAMPAAYSTDSTYSQETNAEQVTYTYNAQNQLHTISTDTTTYTFTYDVFGNDTSVLVGQQTLAQYYYNDYNGKQESVVYGNGHAIKYVYDELDNVKEIWYNDNGGTNWQKAYEYTYTAYGQLYRFDNLLTGKSMMYQYDTSGKLIDATEFDTATGYNTLSVHHGYNGEGRLNGLYYYTEYKNDGGTMTQNEVKNLYAYNLDGMLYCQNIFTQTTAGDITATYDGYHRLVGKTVDVYPQDNSNTRFTNEVEYSYTDSDTHTSGQVSGYTSQINGGTETEYAYTYDQNGNITGISVGNTLLYSYTYDNLGQLIRENNQPLNQTWVYTYDDAGNRTKKETYAYTTGTLGTVQSTVNYSYNNANWGDLLTSVGNTNVTYDAIGNPTAIGNAALTWQGRRLVGMTKVVGDETETWTYQYNDQGIRTSMIYQKTRWEYQGGIQPLSLGGYEINAAPDLPVLVTVAYQAVEYLLDGSRIIGEIVRNASGVEQYRLTYLYDDLDGSPVGMQYRAPTTMGQNEWHTYWFEKNLQGDIVAVYYQDGTKIASYTYDAWGNCTKTTLLSAGDYSYAQYNPFRYRGYYYDTTTGYYYLQSRYYNPQWGRFLNADGYISTDQSLLGYNLFVYCGNNSIMLADRSATKTLVESGIGKVGLDAVRKVTIAPTTRQYVQRRYIKYQVPLYNQKNYAICWAVCQIMIESFYKGENLQQDIALQKAIALAKEVKKQAWNQGGMPTNMGIKYGHISSIEELYILVLKHGPMYAHYLDKEKDIKHYVVITGVDVENNLVYTNNPQGYRGEQSFEDFLNGYVNRHGMRFVPLHGIAEAQL